MKMKALTISEFPVLTFGNAILQEEIQAKSREHRQEVQKTMQEIRSKESSEPVPYLGRGSYLFLGTKHPSTQLPVQN